MNNEKRKAIAPDQVGNRGQDLMEEQERAEKKDNRWKVNPIQGGLNKARYEAGSFWEEYKLGLLGSGIVLGLLALQASGVFDQIEKEILSKIFGP